MCWEVALCSFGYNHYDLRMRDAIVFKVTLASSGWVCDTTEEIGMISLGQAEQPSHVGHFRVHGLEF